MPKLAARNLVWPSLTFLLMMVPLSSEAQIWKRTEEKPDPVWQLKALFNYDFYPFPELNEEKFYTSQWSFNYTTGVELTRSLENDSTAWGGGLLYNYRDFEQELRDQEDSLAVGTPVKQSHKVRYIEIPVIYERQLVIGASSQLSVEGGPIFSFVDEATTTFTLPDGSTGKADINDSDFARFLFGLRGGFNFRKQVSDNLFIQTGYYARLYLTDINKEQFANFTGMQFSLGLVYQFKNPGKSREEK